MGREISPTGFCIIAESIGSAVTVSEVLLIAVYSLVAENELFNIECITDTSLFYVLPVYRKFKSEFIGCVAKPSVGCDSGNMCCTLGCMSP
jgi:hypothetical protein